ncbi:MAG: glycosyltransferase [Phycisphaera sp.]|nr:glycosyltransferase [Phycisphaera sp.]
MRICLFTPTFLPNVGGAEVVTDALAREFVAAGHHAVVLAKGKPAKVDVPYPVKWFRKPISLRARPTAMGPHIANLHAKEHFDVWCVNYAYPTGYGAIRVKEKRGGPPIVVVSHGGDIYRGTRNRSIPAIWKPTVYSYHHADGLIAISPYIEELVREINPDPPPMQLIPNGIDLDAFRRDVPRPADFRLDRPFCLCLGNLGPMKGFDDAIAAYAAARDSLGDLAMVVVGSGELDADLKAQAKALGVSNDVVFMGRRVGDEKLWFLRESRFGLMPSIEEGHPIVGLEFLAVGTPLICSHNAAFDGMYIDGDNAIRVPARDRAALADAIRRMHAADLDAMGRRSMAIAEDYRWSAIAARYVEFFGRVIADAPPRANP